MRACWVVGWARVGGQLPPAQRAGTHTRRLHWPPAPHRAPPPSLPTHPLPPTSLPRTGVKAQPVTKSYVTPALPARAYVAIRIQYFTSTGPSTLMLSWKPPSAGASLTSASVVIPAANLFVKAPVK